MAQLSSTTVFGELSVTAKSLLQGNVGIGTASPAYALDVSGDIRATGTFRGSLTGNASTATTLATARTINGTSFNGSTNITTANWGTARTLTIGSTGKSVNGSGNVSWTLAEIGAAPASHTHPWAQVTDKPSTFTPSSHSHGAGDLPSATTSAKGVVQLSTSTSSTSTSLAATASAVKAAYDLANSKWAYNEATIKAVKVNSAGKADTLATARTINGTSFNGSANITTANWGTARTLTIGSTGKSVNGSGNVSWTLAEIGAAPASHTHTASQVGLGNVQNYGIATQAQAQAGTANNVYMTPLRVKDAISAITKTEIESKLGLNDLLTTHKSTVVGAINELFTDVGNGKTLIAGAITDKGVPTNPSDTFSAMAGNIREIGKPIEKNGDLLFTKESPDYSGNIQALTSDDSYIYVGGSFGQRVEKLNKSDLSVVATSPDFGGSTYALTSDDNYIYIGGTGPDQTVKKLNKSNLSLVAKSSNFGEDTLALTSDDNYIYVGGTYGVVRKLNKSNLSLVATSPDYRGVIYTLTSDDNYIYVGSSFDRTVKKLHKSSFSLMATSSNYGGLIRALTSDDNYVYMGETGAQTVKKLNKSDLSVVAASPNYGGTIRALTSDDNYIYVGGSTIQRVKKLNKSDLSIVARSHSYGGIIQALTTDDNYIYAGGATVRMVKKLNKSVYELDGIDYVRI